MYVCMHIALHMKLVQYLIITMKYINIKTSLIILFFVFPSTTEPKVNVNEDKLEELLNHKYPIQLIEAIPNQKYYYNLLISPPSLRLILLTASLAASGRTRTDLNRLLYGHLHSNFALEFPDIGNQFNVKFRAFLNENMNLTPCFYDVFNFFTHTIDYSTAGKSAYLINNWLRKKTDNTVPQIVLPKFHNEDRTFLTIVFADYLHTTWVKPFVNVLPQNDNSTGTMFLGPMLHQDNTFNYGYLEEYSSYALELPLEKNATMIVLQPKNVSRNFEALKQKLLKYDIRKVVTKLKPTELSVYFPKLVGVKMDRSMVETMKNLKVELPFRREADFRDLHVCGEETFINMFNQRSRFYTNQKEIRLGSATSIQWATTDVHNSVISADNSIDDDDDEDAFDIENDKKSLKEQNMKYISKEPNPKLKKIILVRPFFYVVIKQNRPMWLGTMYKPHNRDINELIPWLREL